MRRILLLSVFVCSSICISAQKTYLTDVKDSQGLVSYGYNDRDLLDSMYMEDFDFKHYDIYEYNEDNGVTKTLGYDPDLTGKFRLTSYIDYEYNDKKQMVLRQNYNDWGSGPEQGGRLSYSYDDEGRLSKIVYEFYMGSNTFEKFMEDIYSYDEQGRLLQIDSHTSDFMTGEWGLSVSLVHDYDGTSERLVSIKRYEIKDNEKKEISKREYSYDDSGNVVSDKTYYKNSDGSYSIASSFDYVYDLTTDASNIVMPYEFEAPDYVHSNIKNKIVSKDYSTINMNNGKFEYVTTFYYEYSSSGAGVPTVMTGGKTGMYLSHDRNRIITSENLTGKDVRICDISGSAVRGFIVCANGVDISMLKSGVYIITAGKKSMKFMK